MSKHNHIQLSKFDLRVNVCAVKNFAASWTYIKKGKFSFLKQRIKSLTENVFTFLDNFH